MLRLQVSGDLDLHGGPEVQQRVDGLLVRERFERIVLDLRDVAFIDSLGLKALLNVRRQARVAGCGLVVLAGEEPVGRILRLTQLDELLDAVIE